MADEQEGTEPDPRFTWANERTFLAWNRTALALIAAGLAVAQFFDIAGRGARIAIAGPLVLLGAAIALTSRTRWDRQPAGDPSRARPPPPRGCR